MSTPFSGGCRCGAVRYTSKAAPMFAGHCHCRDCQYASGGGFSTVLLVPADAVDVKGKTNEFTVTADNGNQVTRRFCPTCGTPMFSVLSGNPNALVIKAGTLDDPSWVKPAMHIWTKSAQPWSEFSGTLPKIEGQPG